MGKLSELKGVEKPVTEWLSKMGWTFQQNEDLKVYARPFGNPILEPLLLEKICELNEIPEVIGRSVMELLISNLTNPNPLSGNENFLEKLVHGVTLTVDGEDRDFKFIDFENIWDNSFIVTNQYWVQGLELVKTDIVLLVNGIPIVPIEAKQRARKGTNWLEGVKQFSTYQMRSDKLFICHAFGVACNGRITKYGIPGASASYFNEWKDTILDTTQDNPILDDKNSLCKTYLDEDTGYWNFDVERLPNGEVLERMKLGVIGLLQPARVLDILKNYIVFERTEGKVIKKVARYQQLRAANKIVDRVVRTDLKQGVIWHTQGSGKSLTMLFTAYKIRSQEELKDPTVYIVLDRKDLRDQLGGTFEDCEFPNARQVMNVADLKHLISTRPAGVFITTIQKFREMGSHVDDRHNIIILIDEAHRTQYGEFQIELQNVLPNARRFAFTGTPIPKTHREFGIREGRDILEYYLDKYGIQDSERDGATKKIRYTFGPQEWFLDKEKLKQGYEDITDELSEDEKRQVERRVRPWKVFLKHPDRIAVLAKDIADDFRNVVEPQGYKAQIVSCDKEACVLYYDELMKYFDPSEVAVIFSTGNYDDQEQYQLYKDHYISDTERKALIAKFKRRITEDEIKNGNNLKIFIVCNMLITGFDAPVEQTMYLDSPLRDHNLLQAVARTNRPYDDPVTKLSKQFGRIVDYVGVFENYQEALNYNPEDIGDFEDVDSLALQFPEVLQKAFKPFEAVKLEDSYECAMAIVRVLNEIDQGKFENDFHEVIQLYESLAPHPSLREHRHRYLWLTEIYEIYLEEFKRLDFDAEFYALKTRKLIQENAKLINFRGHLPEITIDANYIDQLNATKLGPTDKAEKIIRDIETVIRRNELDSPIYEEFQNRLDDLVRQKKDDFKRIEVLLEELTLLYAELDDIATLPQRLGFEDRGTFDIFTEIKNARAGSLDELLAKQFVKDLFDNVIKKRIYMGWQENDLEPKRLKVDISIFAASDEYQGLQIDDDSELLDRIMKRVIQHYSLD
jgi:type I restriction enzyme R subunit